MASTTIASAAWEDGWGEERRRRLEEERDKYYMRFQWQMASYICFREVNIQRMANMSRSDEDRYHLSWVMRISQKLAKFLDTKASLGLMLVTE